MKKILLSLICISTVLLADYTRGDDNNTVTDNATKLMWQDDIYVSVNHFTWYQAINSCEGLTLNGYSDWRLPNINELYSIVDRDRSYPAHDPSFLYAAPDFYWSSTTRIADPAFAWYLRADNGVDHMALKTDINYFRCVRGGL